MSNSTQNDWEVRFNDRFMNNWGTLLDIKHFIRKELADARREDVEDFLRGFMTYINVGKPESSVFIKKVSKVLNEYLATLRKEERRV